MKKINAKKIIFPAIAALSFGVLSVGTTFALFTDKAETSISVKAGKIKVNTALTIEEVSSLNSFDTGNAVATDKKSATLSQGGKATINAVTNELAIDRMIPGDRVVLKMANGNESNVLIKHRVTKLGASYIFNGNNEKVADTSNYKLHEKLQVKFYSDAALTNEVTDYMAWSDPVDGATLSTYYIEIVFPDGDNGAIKFGSENLDNVYQNKACEFAFSLEAVQGNADTLNGVRVNNTEELQAALNNLVDNDLKYTVYLNPGNYGDVILQAKDGYGNTVVQENAAHNTALSPDIEFNYRHRSLSNVVIEGATGANVRSIRFMSGRCGVTKGYNYVHQNPYNDENYTFDSLEVKNITIKNINFNGAGVYFSRGYNTYDWQEMIAGTQKLGEFKDIVIDKCNFEPDWNTTTSPISIPEGYFYKSHEYGGVSVQVNHWDNESGKEYIYTKNVTIKNSTFKNILGVSPNVQDSRAIDLQLVEGDIKILNNTFTNTYYNHIQMNQGFKHDGTIAITGNHFGDNHDRMLRFNGDYSGLKAFDCSGNYFHLTTTGETDGPYGKTSASNYNTTIFPNGKLPLGANYWEDTNITTWQGTAVMNGFSIVDAQQSYIN